MIESYLSLQKSIICHIGSKVLNYGERYGTALDRITVMCDIVKSER